MKCLHCGLENPEGIELCLECGTPLELRCPKCREVAREPARFCTECGCPLRAQKEEPPIDFSQPRSYTPKHLAERILTNRSAIEGERKLVTVLLADVANYTSLCEKLDPEEIHRIMNGCFKTLMEKTHRYEGTIDQFTADGVVVLFGAPVAHEDHAQGACHAALSIRNAIEAYGEKIEQEYGLEFRMRIGLNSGPVIVGPVNDDLRMDYTAVGDTTKLAHRIKEMARAGAVLVSQHTQKLASDFFEFNLFDQVPAKGTEEPQEAYELIRASEFETRLEAASVRGLTKFVGRNREMKALQEAFEKARSGSGQVVGVVGEAGVGKSRLIVELKNMLTRAGSTFLQGRCLHYGGSIPYLPILEILKSYFGVEEQESQATTMKKLRKKLRDLDEEMADVPPALQEILSVRVEDERYLQLGPQQKKYRTIEALRDLLVRESRKKPLVLVVEDVHWIDKSSQELLDHIIGSLPNTRILLLLLYRPEYTHTWGNNSYYSQIGLGQLSAPARTALVKAVLEGQNVSPEVSGLILGRAGGNPLFVEELTFSLLENGSIQPEEDQYVLTPKASAIDVPETLLGIIAARMDRLEMNLKWILQVASVIGREFDYRVLETIIGMEEELKSRLLDLQDMEFVFEKQLSPEFEYIFKHALTQEVAYNSLLLRTRRDIHEKIGKAIEHIRSERLEEHYELLAYHYVQSDNRPKAVRYLCLANRKAAASNAMEEAKDYFDTAMEYMDRLPDTAASREQRISLLVDQSAVFQLLFKHPEYHALLKRYEDLANGLPDSGLAGVFYARLAQCECAFGNFRQALQVGGEAVKLCEAKGNPEDAGFAYSMLEVASLWSGDLSRALALKHDVLRMMRKQFNLRYYTYAFVFAAWAKALMGRWESAIEDGKEALRAVEKASDESLISFAGWFLSGVHTLKGDLERALEYARKAEQEAPTLADKAWTQAAMAWAMCHSGEPGKGTELLEAILPLFRAGRYMPALFQSMLILGEGYWLAGRYDEAGRLLDEILETTRNCEARGYLAWACRVMGEVNLETDPTRAGPLFEQSISLFGEMGAENELAKSWAGYGRCLARSGKTREAKEVLSKALDTFERLGTLIEPDKVRKALAALPE